MSARAVYGIATYGKAIYGDPHALVGTPKNSYDGISLGNWVRKQLEKVVIFRVQRSNGNYGGNVGELYQHRYPYFIPVTIMHPNGDASRATFADAVGAWKVLPAAGKAAFNFRATHREKMTGFNLFISEYMKLNYAP